MLHVQNLTTIVEIKNSMKSKVKKFHIFFSKGGLPFVRGLFHTEICLHKNQGMTTLQNSHIYYHTIFSKGNSHFFFKKWFTICSSITLRNHLLSEISSDILTEELR